MPHDVFVSYVEEDRATAHRVCEGLESQGIRCWIAPRNITPGQTWGAAIIEAIDKSSVLVLIFSSRTNLSKQVVRELEHADQTGVRIVPFRIEDVAPSGDIEYFLGSIQWLDAFSGPFETQLQELIETLGALLNIPVAAIGPGKREKPEKELVSEERILDAALPAQVPVEKPTELVVMVRRADSKGLRAILAVEDSYLVTEGDVRSKPFDLEFPLNEEGEPTAAELTLKVDSPDFEPKSQQKKILVPPRIDSEAYVFLLTPKFKGQLVVSLEVYKRDLAVASRVLKTRAETSDREILSRVSTLVSIPLYVVSYTASESVKTGMEPAADVMAKAATGGQEVIPMLAGQTQMNLPRAPAAAIESMDETRVVKVADAHPLPDDSVAPQNSVSGTGPDTFKPPCAPPISITGPDVSRPSPQSRKRAPWIAGTGAIAALFFCSLFAYFQISRSPQTGLTPPAPKGESPAQVAESSKPEISRPSPEGSAAPVATGKIPIGRGQSPRPERPRAYIDLNSATKELLMTLPGVSELLSQEIIAGRPYKSKSDLLTRKIIPETTYNKIADKVIVK